METNLHSLANTKKLDSIIYPQDSPEKLTNSAIFQKEILHQILKLMDSVFHSLGVQMKFRWGGIKIRSEMVTGCLLMETICQ